MRVQWLFLCFFYFFCVLLTISIVNGYAADLDRRHVSIQFENDVLAETDRYYTHATRFDYQFALNHNPVWLDWYRKLLPDAGNRDTVLGIFLAQYIYTPSDITIPNPPEDERPYGGWLHVGIQGTSIENSDLADAVAVNLGIIGPASWSADDLDDVSNLLGRSETPAPWKEPHTLGPKMLP